MYLDMMKRVVQSAGGGGDGDAELFGSLGSSPLLITLAVVVVCGVAGLLASALLVVAFRRRNGEHADDLGASSMKHFRLPTNVKPVIKFKSGAAGPGGLKNSPSPLQSPESSNLMLTSSERVQPPSHGSASPNVQMSPVDDIDKVASEIADAARDVANQEPGILNFSMNYSYEKNALQVTIHSAINLPQLPNTTADSSHAPLLDPYVKLQLLPEKQHKVKTRVVRNTCSPVYDETFTFYGISAEQLQSTTLHFAVVAFDRFSRDEIVGEVVCALQQIDLSDSECRAELAMPLVSRQTKFENVPDRGELLLSVCYQPATNKVTVVVLKAKNLPKFDVSGLADPYVKVYMLYNGQKLAKKKTHIKKRTLTPVYNESFIFDLPSADPAALDDVSFEFAIMDWDRVTRNEVMGRCVLGVRAPTDTGRSHWEQVRRQPRRQIAEWHRLRP